MVLQNIIMSLVMCIVCSVSYLKCLVYFLGGNYSSLSSVAIPLNFDVEAICCDKFLILALDSWLSPWAAINGSGSEGIEGPSGGPK